MMTLYHLVGRDTANPEHPNQREFSLRFSDLSPFAAAEILGLSEPQVVRCMRAYDIAKAVLRDFYIFPAKGNEEEVRLAMEVDEFERGYPRMTLSILMDVVVACLKVAETPRKEDKSEKGKDAEKGVEFTPYNEKLKTPEGKKSLQKWIYAGPRQITRFRGVLFSGDWHA